MTRLLISGGVTAAGEHVDVLVVDGLVHGIAESGTLIPDRDCESLELGGRLILPSLVEPHAHLDKAFLADRIPNESGDLLGAIMGLSTARESIDTGDIVERATAAALLLSKNGVTTVRTHADTTLDNGLESVLALCEVRDACAGFIDIQVAALVEWPLTGLDGASRRSLARDAIESGADVVGGCPHLDADPAGAIEFLLSLALDKNIPLDLHADENLRDDSLDVEILADMMLTAAVTHEVAASHCVSLSVMDEEAIARISDKVARAGISVISLPQTNLYLQGRSGHSLVPRSIAPVNMLRKHGVVTAAGGDNLQDPFNPMGRGDPFEIASLMVTAAHVPPIEAFTMVTTAARHAVGADPAGLQVGARADFVAIRSTTVRESIAFAPHDRIVVHRGTVIDDHIRNRK